MELKTIKVGDFTVSEAGPLHAARSVNFRAQFQALIESMRAKGDNVTEDDLERVQGLSNWMTVGAVTDPRLSMDDWMTIPITVHGELIEAARKLNPTWFEEVTPASEKKRKLKHKPTMTG